MRSIIFLVTIFLCTSYCYAAPEIFWRETPTEKIKIEVESGKVTGRWSFPKITAPAIFKPTNDWSINEPTEEIIKAEAIIAWDNNFQMQAFQIKQQRAAIRTLEEGPPSGIPTQVFKTIRNKARLQWPRNYQMRAFQEKQQIKAWKELQ